MPKQKTICGLELNGGCTGIRANTPDSKQDPEEHSPPPLDAPESPLGPDDQGRQGAVAAVRPMNPSAFLARISATVTQNTSAIISDVRRLYVVSDGDQAPGASYRNSCRNGAHRYNQDLAKADTSSGAGDVCPCTLSIPGRRAGPAISWIERKKG